MNTIVINSDGTINFDGRIIKEGSKLAIKDGMFYLEGSEVIQEFLFNKRYEPTFLATLKVENVKKDWFGKSFAVGWVTHSRPKPISIVTNCFCIIGEENLVNWE